MKNIIIFTILLMLSIGGVSGQGVDPNNSRTEKIKTQLLTYLNDDFPNNGVEYIKKEIGSLDIKDKITLYAFYLTKLKEYYDSRKQKINNQIKLKSLLNKYEGGSGYDYVWNKYKDKADKAWMADKDRWNLTGKVKRLINSKELEFISNERDILKTQVPSKEDYNKFDHLSGDIELAIQNIKDDILQLSKDQNSNEMVMVNNKANVLREEVKKYRELWNSYVCNEYLNLTEFNIYIYNPNMFSPTRTFIKSKLPGQDGTLREDVVISISMINKDMIKAANVEAQRNYREIFKLIKENFKGREFEDFKEAQLVYESIAPSEPKSK